MLNFGQNWYESTQFRFNNLTSPQGHHDPVCGWMYPPFVGGWGDLDGKMAFGFDRRKYMEREGCIFQGATIFVSLPENLCSASMRIWI